MEKPDSPAQQIATFPAIEWIPASVEPKEGDYILHYEVDPYNPINLRVANSPKGPFVRQMTFERGRWCFEACPHTEVDPIQLSGLRPVQYCAIPLPPGVTIDAI